ncbi:hypothetical protein IMZ31_22590 (plasmid) [Pontibacillus sp. ALD_SL1]|uniref:hypothetical protein n=1 Tax=Pontibacillus sp. ALD_SL1 TaxID=2777185 RepID=UPI001A96D2ED|nr:hypothetical protein [Pontibacillus sp. ALD_SL1]QST02245.1 hypothetical protein IMZ31_22590 [Pontibacillus sp. ALD_SL1]
MLTKAEMEHQWIHHGVITTHVDVTLEELIESDYGIFLNILSERITGDILTLDEIKYDIAAHDAKTLTLLVTAEPATWNNRFESLSS